MLARAMKLFGIDPFSRLGRGVLAVVVATVAGLGIGVLLVPRAPGAEDPDEPPPKIALLGQSLVLDDHATQRALEMLRRHVAGSFHVELPDGGQRRLSFGRLGAQIDKVRLSQLIRDARDATSPMRRVFRTAG